MAAISKTPDRLRVLHGINKKERDEEINKRDEEVNRISAPVASALRDSGLSADEAREASEVVAMMRLKRMYLEELVQFAKEKIPSIMQAPVESEPGAVRVVIEHGPAPGSGPDFWFQGQSPYDDVGDIVISVPSTGIGIEGILHGKVANAIIGMYLSKSNVGKVSLFDEIVHDAFDWVDDVYNESGLRLSFLDKVKKAASFAYAKHIAENISGRYLVADGISKTEFLDILSNAWDGALVKHVHDEDIHDEDGEVERDEQKI